MTTPIANAQIYGDFAGLESLKKAARSDDPAAIREVARQFESLFARMLIKSMRDAIGPDPIFGSDQEQAYQSMYDDQLSLELTRGHGLGLADMLVRQLQRRGIGADHGAAAAQGEAGNTGSATPAQSPAAVAPARSTRSTPTMPERATPSMGPAQRSGPSMPSSRSTPSIGPKVSRTAERSFIRAIWPQARQAAAQLGVAPESLVAQAALETDWGRNVPQDAGGISSHNLFGIKSSADWGGPSVSAGTREFSGGSARETLAQFRAYDSPAQSFEDYVAVLRSNPRYAAALNTGSNVAAFASALQRGGYATDPQYARKVSAVASDVASVLSESAPARPSPTAAEPLLARNGAEPLKLEGAGPITGGADSLL